MTTTGTITTDGVRFERRYDATPEQVWAALTQPEQLRGWLAAPKLWSLEPGAAYELAFDDGSVSGRIVTVEPARLLEITWGSPAEPESHVRFELRPADGGCVVVLAQPRLARGRWARSIRRRGRRWLRSPAPGRRRSLNR
jgi:uncharacterized protein YndB with AHSA1/START domain